MCLHICIVYCVAFIQLDKTINGISFVVVCPTACVRVCEWRFNTGFSGTSQDEPLSASWHVPRIFFFLSISLFMHSYKSTISFCLFVCLCECESEGRKIPTKKQGAFWDGERTYQNIFVQIEFSVTLVKQKQYALIASFSLVSRYENKNLLWCNRHIIIKIATGKI